MGGCASKEPEGPGEEEDIDVSQDVELQLMEQQIGELFKFKILLLGAGESGKSTVIKQIKLIHKKKITPEDRVRAGISLHQNTVDCMKALLGAVNQFATFELDEEDRKTESALSAHDETKKITPDLGARILRLWESKAVQHAYSRRSEFWLLDSFPYYIRNLNRFTEDDFSPSDEDIVMARIRTTGIVVDNLESKIVQEHKDEPDTLQFQVVDVGGQRNERKKWMHCFDDVRAILFIVNLAGYNQVLFEDNSKNRIEEELELFEKVAHNPIFAETPIFLFLNKKDLFESMIKETDLKVIFKDYEGGKDLDAALKYIEGEFKKKMPPTKALNVQIVTASYKRDIKCAFEDVKKTLYDMNRKVLLAKVMKIRKDQRALLADKRKRAKAGCCGGSGSKAKTSSAPAVVATSKYNKDNE